MTEDYAHLLRRAITALEREPSLVHGDEFRSILIEWFTWGAEDFEAGTWTDNRRLAENPEAAPGIKMARLLVGHAGHP